VGLKKKGQYPVSASNNAGAGFKPFCLNLIEVINASIKLRRVCQNEGLEA